MSVEQASEIEQRYQEFTRLRQGVIREQVLRKVTYDDLVAANPPTEDEREWERRLGTPLPFLEPQVEAAVRRFNENGYPTVQSGFMGPDNPDIQFIEGPFPIDKETKARLAAVGVETTIDKVETRQWGKEYGDLTVLRFRAATPDLNQIKAKWDTIAAILPNRNQSTTQQ